jgi:AcrR family transcriptional regulator
MVKAAVGPGWRKGRRQSAQSAILAAAWELVREEGLAGLSMRDLARRAGITAPTVYAYFESKNEIYDAMFGQAAEEFTAVLAGPYGTDDPAEMLLEGARRFASFCTADVPRYQLLFQRTVPGFEPSAESYAHAIAALESARERLALNGITDPRHVDLWTALNTGLIDQQISNDPGGDRWTRLIDESTDMFLEYCKGGR